MTRDEQAVLDAVMTFLDSYAKRSVELCMSAIATSKPILMFGTNDNEVFKSSDDMRAAFTRDFDSMTNIRWGERRNLHIDAAPTLASVLIELPLTFQSEGKETATLFRYALTLIKEGEQWRISSGMASVPFPAGTYSFSQP